MLLYNGLLVFNFCCLQVNLWRSDTACCVFLRCCEFALSRHLQLSGVTQMKNRLSKSLASPSYLTALFSCNSPLLQSVATATDSQTQSSVSHCLHSVHTYRTLTDPGRGLSRLVERAPHEQGWILTAAGLNPTCGPLLRVTPLCLSLLFPTTLSAVLSQKNTEKCIEICIF